MSPKLAYLAEVAAALQGGSGGGVPSSVPETSMREGPQQESPNLALAPAPDPPPDPFEGGMSTEPGMSMAPPTPPDPNEDPRALVSRAAQQMSSPGVAVPKSTPDPNELPFALAPSGGGNVPAHEVEKRGPSLLEAQANRNRAVEGAISNVSDRNEHGAQLEYDMALDQERQARMREAAMQQSIAERQEELAQRQADYDDTVSKLGRMGNIDPGRFWASRTTGQKVAGIVELMLSGMSGAPSMLLKRIDDDVKAQEFAYHATRDTAAAQQNAFGMAMQKYQNTDAARAAARAAAIDVTQAQLAQISAKWKGTEAANRADEARANLQNEKMLQIQAGIQFVPAQQRGPVYIDRRTGLPYDLPGIRKVAEKYLDAKDTQTLEAGKVGGQLMLQRDRAALEGAEGGMTKEQRGKMAMERADLNLATSEFNAQIADLKEHPAITRSGLLTSALSLLPQRVAPDSNQYEQDLHEINTRVLQAIGKVAKDADGKPNKSMIERLEKRFEIHQGDTVPMKQQKLVGALSVYNALARQQGATNAPSPNSHITDDAAKELESSTSVKFGKKR